MVRNGNGTKWLWYEMTFFVIDRFSRQKSINLKSINIQCKINTDSHPAVLFDSLKFCAPVVFVWFWLFLLVLEKGGRQYKRGSDITIFFPNIAFYEMVMVRNDFFRHWQISRQKSRNLKSINIQCKINNNNKTNTKHEFNVKYER
jgi:5-hydroxyisourate hydrolase-like protein (transthyretin family)